MDCQTASPMNMQGLRIRTSLRHGTAAVKFFDDTDFSACNLIKINILSKADKKFSSKREELKREQKECLLGVLWCVGHFTTDS
jgi:hypothetical protein